MSLKTHLLMTIHSYDYSHLNSSFTDYNCNTSLALSADFYLSSLSQPHSAELQEQLLSCLGSDCLSTREYWDKKVNKPRRQI